MPAIIQCASSYIADTKQFVYSKYDICSFLYLLCKTGKYKNEPIKPLPESDSIDAGFILKQLATAKMEKELSTYFDDYIKLKLPKLEKIKLESIKGRSVHNFSSNTPGKFKKMGENLRVSKIGRTFLDMLRKPQLCGGINHVIEVFTNHAETYLQFIIDEIEKDGKPIDKVRAGYILEEECNLQHKIFEQWRQYKQRGSSRKLDASSDFDAEKLRAFLQRIQSSNLRFGNARKSPMKI